MIFEVVSYQYYRTTTQDSESTQHSRLYTRPPNQLNSRFNADQTWKEKEKETLLDDSKRHTDFLYFS